MKKIPRPDLAEIARALACIASPPNERAAPSADDLDGHFDYWFDGGACRMDTGVSRYEFASGLRATMPILPALSIRIESDIGWSVVLSEPPAT